jgi:hypothetical protein
MSVINDNPISGRRCVVDSSQMQFLAAIAEPDFSGFKSAVAELQSWPSHEDFVLERDGFFLGLSWGGVNAVQVEVPLRAFTRWVELTGAPASILTLDDLAMRRWLRARYPHWVVTLVRLKEAACANDQKGQLEIPVYPSAAGEGQSAPSRSDPGSDSALVSAILAGCLDAAI